jgi:hypothetical protein
MTPHTPTYNRDKALLNLIGTDEKQQARIAELEARLAREDNT